MAEYSPEKGYVASESERGLDCKQITGRMEVRILEIRDYNERQRASGFSNFVQTAVTSTLGGPQGPVPYAQEVARLKAYNELLKAKDCQSFDLDAELQPKAVSETPSATVKAHAASTR